MHRPLPDEINTERLRLRGPILADRYARV